MPLMTTFLVIEITARPQPSRASCPLLELPAIDLPLPGKRPVDASMWCRSQASWAPGRFDAGIRVGERLRKI